MFVWCILNLGVYILFWVCVLLFTSFALVAVHTESDRCYENVFCFY